MTVTIPTSEAQYGYVVGRVIRALGDSADADDKPDAVAATGKVTFTPKATLGRTTDYSAFIVREKLDAPLDAQGNLVRYEGATPAGISLTVGAYKVEFALASGSIPSFEIEVTAAHTQAAPLDLVTAAPYVPPSGVTVQTMLVPADAVVGQVLGWSASGLDWVDMVGGGGGAVSSVAGRTGAVVLSSADLTDAASLATDAELTAGLAGKADALGADDNYVTDAEKVKLANLSGTNTGDQVLPTWSTLSGKPAVIAAGATQADARTAIGAGTSNLAIGTTGTTAAAGNRQATETAIGMVELATTAEATAGTDTQRAVTPAGLKAVADTLAKSTHDHDDRYVRTVNGTGPDAAGDVAVSGGGGGSGSLTIPRSGFWHASVYMSGIPGGATWPTQNRIYFQPHVHSSAVTVTAIAFNVTAASDPTSSLRWAVFRDSAGMPGVLVEQGVVDSTVIGAKTVTLAAELPLLAGERFWLALGPQGTGATGGAWLGAAQAGTLSTGESTSVWAGSSFGSSSLMTSSSSALASNPVAVSDGNVFNRFPYMVVRIK